MEIGPVLDRIEQELEPILKEFDAEIVGLSLKRAGGRLVLQLLTDKKDGITVDECALINQRLGDIIDSKNLINERYLLEVSSPGLNRPLKQKRDFERAKGKEVNISLLIPVNNKNFICGTVKSADEVSLILEGEDKKEISIDYTNIARARLKIKL